MILHKVSSIGFYTFKELFKSKILLNVFFVGLGLVALTFVATSFTYGVPERVAIDFGLGMLSVSSMAISLFLGVGLVSKEIESRTVYMIISRPVPRFAFILGKIFGLLGIQLLNIIILGLMTAISVCLLGGNLDDLFYWAVFFTFLESILLLMLVSFTSLFTNNILAVLFSIIIFLMGHAIKDTQNILFVQTSPLLKNTLKLYEFVLPAFYKLNLKDFVIYKRTLDLDYLLKNILYGVTYSLALLSLIIGIFNKKNLD